MNVRDSSVTAIIWRIQLPFAENFLKLKPVISKTKLNMTEKHECGSRSKDIPTIEPENPQPEDGGISSDDNGILVVNGERGAYYPDREVDNEHQWVIPSQVELPHGPHTLHVKSPDGVTASKENIPIEAGKTTRVTVSYGELRVNLDPKDRSEIRNNPAFLVTGPGAGNPLPPGYGYLVVVNSTGGGGYFSLDNLNWKTMPTSLVLTPSTGYTVYAKSLSGGSVGSKSPVPVVSGKTTTLKVTFNPP